MSDRGMHMRRIPVLFCLALIFCFLTMSCKKQGITTEVIDGVNHIHNPAEPLKGTIDLEVEETLRIDPAQFEIEDFVVFDRFWKDPVGNVYLMIWKSRNVFQFSGQGDYLGSFIRIGQGPGEFPQYSSLFLDFIREGEIWATGGRKIARFDMGRNLLGEIKLDNWYSPVKYVDENRLIAERRERVEEGKEMHEWTIVSYIERILEGEDKILFDYCKAKDIGLVRKGQSAFSDSWATPGILWIYDDYTKRIYTVLSTEYKISAHELAGESLFVFDKAHKNFALNMDEKRKHFKEKYEENWEWWLDIYPDELCAIRDIKCLPKGYVAVYPITGIEAINIDIYDPEGRFLYVLNPPQGLSLEEAQFSDFGFILKEEKEDRDVYAEYRIKNLPEIFGYK
jgi:hypothetical protein